MLHSYIQMQVYKLSRGGSINSCLQWVSTSEPLSARKQQCTTVITTFQGLEKAVLVHFINHELSAENYQLCLQVATFYRASYNKFVRMAECLVDHVKF